MQVRHHSSKIASEDVEFGRLQSFPHAVLLASCCYGFIIFRSVQVRDVALCVQHEFKFKFNFNAESLAVLRTLLMSSSMASNTICVSLKRKTAGWALMPA